MMCVDCGADVPQVIDGSCAACFSQKHELMVVPEVTQVEICAHCRARHVGAHWYDVPPEDPEEWILEESMRESIGVHHEVDVEALRIGLQEKDNKTFAVHAVLDGYVQDVPVHVEHHALLRRSRGVCDRCSRVAGGAYAAIIQLRASDRDMTDAELRIGHKIVAQDLDRQLEGGNRFAYLAKSGAVHGGFDYYIGDIEAARNVSRRLKSRMGGSIQQSAKLVGRREGEDVYRVTFLMRLDPFGPGDIVVKDQRAYAVLAVHQKDLAVMELERARRDRMPTSHLRRLGGVELIQAAVVVNRGPEGVMILDPDTQRTTTLLVPEDVRVEETLPVVRVEERLFWVPFDLPDANNP